MAAWQGNIQGWPDLDILDDRRVKGRQYTQSCLPWGWGNSSGQDPPQEEAAAPLQSHPVLATLSSRCCLGGSHGPLMVTPLLRLPPS